jgi:hypothetical protein
LFSKRDIRHWKIEIWKVFPQLPEVEVSTSGGVNIFKFSKRDLIKWYRIQFHSYNFNFLISFFTSGDDWKWRTKFSTPYRTPTKWDLSSLKIWWLEKNAGQRNLLFGHICRPEVKFQKTKKPNLVHFITHLPWKFHENLSSHFWEIAGTKKGKRIIIRINRRISRRSSVENGRP